MPFGAVQIVSTIGGAALATRIKKKFPVLLLICIPPLAGILMLMFISHDPQNRGALLAGYYLISFYPGITPLIYSWEAQNTAGDTKRKVTTSMLFVGASTGNIIGPLLFRPNEAPRYARGLRANLALFVTLILLVCITAAWIRILNIKHSRMRERLGKPAYIVDQSMEQSTNITSNAQDTSRPEADKGFSDVTDLRNEDFVYVY